jgi:transcription elongation factor GreA
MDDHRMLTPGAARRPNTPPPSLEDVPPPVATRVQLSAGDYAELMRELDELRSRHRGEIAQRLRDARDFGSPGDDDDRLAVFEDAAVIEARIAQLEHLARSASVVAVDLDADGVANLGSTVRVADEAGDEMVFVLVGRRVAESTRREVSLASPVGKALIGVRPGDVARVVLPSGRARQLRVLDVTNNLPAQTSAPPEAAVEAA